MNPSPSPDPKPVKHTLFVQVDDDGVREIFEPDDELMASLGWCRIGPLDVVLSAEESADFAKILAQPPRVIPELAGLFQRRREETANGVNGHPIPDLITAPQTTDLIDKVPGRCGGRACIAGTRLYVSLFVRERRGGTTDEQILKAWPYITWEQLGAAFEYADANKTEIEAELSERGAGMCACASPSVETTPGGVTYCRSCGRGHRDLMSAVTTPDGRLGGVVFPSESAIKRDDYVPLAIVSPREKPCAKHAGVSEIDPACEGCHGVAKAKGAAPGEGKLVSERAREIGAGRAAREAEGGKQMITLLTAEDVALAVDERLGRP